MHDCHSTVRAHRGPRPGALAQLIVAIVAVAACSREHPRAPTPEPPAPPVAPPPPPLPSPAPPALASGPIVEIAAHGAHACARTRDGAVLCWGDNHYGQLGDGTTSDRPMPRPVPALRDAEQLALGLSYTCARVRGGGVACAGLFHRPIERPGTVMPAPVTTLAPVTGMTDLAQLASAATLMCARRADGRVQCVGGDIAGSLTTSMLLAAHSPPGGPRATSWGSEDDGCRMLPPARSGAGSGTLYCCRPGMCGDVPDLPAPTEVPDLRDVAQLTLGFESHACALLRDGGVRCWGSNSRGQLGDGSLVARLDPVPVAGLSGVAEVTAGAYFTCARMTDGTARCWGDNEFGQLGDGTTTARREPAVVAGLTDVAQLALGFYHACARRTDGTVWCWGRGHLGQLGRGRPEHHRVHPTRVDGVRDATWLAMGQNHSCALQADGAAYCWGNNGSGQLGDGTREDRARPVRVAWGGS